MMMAVGDYSWLYDEPMRLENPRYFDGSTCERGHVCERYTESKQCVECAKIEGRQRLQNAELELA